MVQIDNYCNRMFIKNFFTCEKKIYTLTLLFCLKKKVNVQKTISWLESQKPQEKLNVSLKVVKRIDFYPKIVSSYSASKPRKKTNFRNDHRGTNVRRPSFSFQLVNKLALLNLDFCPSGILLFQLLAYLEPLAPLCSPFGYGQVSELVGGLNPYFLMPASCSEGHKAHVRKDTWQHVRKDTLSTCSEGHKAHVRKDTWQHVQKDTLSIMFGRTHCIMFRRTLFRI